MQISAQSIADILEGKLSGNPDQSIQGLSKIDDGKPNTLTFLANPAYTDFIYTTKASVAIVSKSFKAEKELPEKLTIIEVDDSRIAFGKLLEMYTQLTKPAPGIHTSAVVDKSSSIHESVYIGPGVVIESNCSIGPNTEIHAHSFIGSNTQLGSDCHIHPKSHIGHHSIIGNHCTLQPGVVLGGDGFGFAPNGENQYQKVVHVGNVILEDYVEVGANTTIDRATLGSTIIKKGVKLDNLIQVAHNCEIGENTVIAAQTGIAGSTKIGKNCMIGGQVGIVGHIQIADGVKIAAQSGIGSSIEEKDAVVQGSPALPIRDFKKSYVHFRNLDALADQIRILNQKPKPTNDG